MAIREATIERVAAPAEAIRPAAVRRAESKSLFVSFLELLFGRWMIIAGIFGSASFWAYFTLARAPDTYGATAQVLIRRGKLQAVQDVPVLRQQEEIGSDVDILTSIAVLNEVVSQILERAQKPQNTDFGERQLIFGYDSTRPRYALTVSDLPTTDSAQLFKYLKNRFRIQKFGESNVIQVTLESPRAIFAAEAVNTLIDVYEKFNLTVEQSPGQSQFYAQEIRKIDDEIDGWQNELASYKSAHRIVDVERQQELLALRRHNLTTDLDKLLQDKAAVQTDLQAIQRPDSGQTTAFMRTDQLIVKLRQDVLLRVAELDELESKLTAENPLVVAKHEEVADLQRRLDDEEQHVNAQQKHLYQQILDRETELRKEIQEVDARLQEYPFVAAEIERHERDIKQSTIKRGDLVERMFKSTTLEKPGEAMNKVKVIGYAAIPVLPVEARKDFKFLVAVVFSLILAFVAAGFVESLDHTVRKREQVEEHLEIPHLASISTHYS